MVPDPDLLDSIGIECPVHQTLVDHVCTTPEAPDPEPLPVEPPGGGSGSAAQANGFSAENQQFGPVVAGDDLQVAALIYSNCIAGAFATCGQIEVTLSFTTISGEVLTLSQTYEHAGSQRAAFVIPGEHVHWWNTDTRTPYVFGYWYRATQTQSGVPVETRAPAAPGTMYERAVRNVLRGWFQDPDGARADGVVDRLTEGVLANRLGRPANPYGRWGPSS